MNIDYDELRRIYRLEKNTSRLVDVEEDFFVSLNSFMKTEKEAYLKSLTDPSSSKATSFSNLQKLLVELFELREKKLLNKALVSSRTGDDTVFKSSKEEQKTFKKMLTVLKEHRFYLDSIFGNSEKETQEKKDLNNSRIRILKEVPSFVGSDMKEYGPFKEKEEVELPQKTASLLIKRELAELND